MSDSFATPWTVAHQGPLCMGFPRQEYWSELPFPSPGDLPRSGIKPESPCLLHWQVDSLPLGPPGKIFVSILPSKTLASGKDCLSVMSRQSRIESGSVCVVTQLCPTLCDPLDCSPPGSSVHGILQARILEWVAISFSMRVVKDLAILQAQEFKEIWGEFSRILSKPKSSQSS